MEPMDELAPYLDVIQATRDQLLADLSPEDRAFVDAAVAEHVEMTARRRQRDELEAKLFTDRQAAWGTAWEQVLRATGTARL